MAWHDDHGPPLVFSHVLFSECVHVSLFFSQEEGKVELTESPLWVLSDDRDVHTLLNSRLLIVCFTPHSPTLDPQTIVFTLDIFHTCSWSTFCNHLSGEWVGQYGAYTPWEGKPEPVWLDGNNK